MTDGEALWADMPAQARLALEEHRSTVLDMMLNNYRQGAVDALVCLSEALDTHPEVVQTTRSLNNLISACAEIVVSTTTAQLAARHG